MSFPFKDFLHEYEQIYTQQSVIFVSYLQIVIVACKLFHIFNPLSANLTT